MTSKLIQIGNSKGLRIPKNLIAKYHLGDELELVETEKGILIKPKNSARHNWKQLIEAESLDNTIGESLNIDSQFDSNEWTW